MGVTQSSEMVKTLVCPICGEYTKTVRRIEHGVDVRRTVPSCSCGVPLAIGEISKADLLKLSYCDETREAMTTDACIWKQLDPDDYGNQWETTCGHQFEINNDDGPKKNSFRFCCYCGKPLTEAKYVPPSYDEDELPEYFVDTQKEESK